METGCMERVVVGSSGICGSGLWGRNSSGRDIMGGSGVVVV